MVKYLILFLSVILLFGCKTEQTENKAAKFPVLTGKYLGQDEPGLIPELFAPNIVSTGMNEINACFSPDYTEYLFSIIIHESKFVIMSMKYDGHKWSAPEVASFSGEYSEADPFITADGKYLYFVSRRPIDSLQIPKNDWDIWRVEK